MGLLKTPVFSTEQPQPDVSEAILAASLQTAPGHGHPNGYALRSTFQSQIQSKIPGSQYHHGYHPDKLTGASKFTWWGKSQGICHSHGTRATQLGAGLEPIQPHFQHSHLHDLLLETRMWRRRKQEKERATESYLSTRFEAVKGLQNENMGYVCSSFTHSCCSSFLHKVVA